MGAGGELKACYTTLATTHRIKKQHGSQCTCQDERVVDSSLTPSVPLLVSLSQNATHNWTVMNLQGHKNNIRPSSVIGVPG